MSLSLQKKPWVARWSMSYDEPSSALNDSSVPMVSVISLGGVEKSFAISVTSNRLPGKYLTLYRKLSSKIALVVEEP